MDISLDFILFFMGKGTGILNGFRIASHCLKVLRDYILLLDDHRKQEKNQRKFWSLKKKILGWRGGTMQLQEAQDKMTQEDHVYYPSQCEFVKLTYWNIKTLKFNNFKKVKRNHFENTSDQHFAFSLMRP